MRKQVFASSLAVCGALAGISISAQTRELATDSVSNSAVFEVDLLRLSSNGTGGNPDKPIDPKAHDTPAAAGSVRADASPGVAEFGQIIDWLRSAARKPPPPPPGDPGTGGSPEDDVSESLAKQLEDYKAFKAENPSSEGLAPLPSLSELPSARPPPGQPGGGAGGTGGTGGNTDRTGNNVSDVNTRLQQWISTNPLPQGWDRGTGQSLR